MISHLAQQRENALRSKYHELERILKAVRRENRVKDECLELAMATLRRLKVSTTWKYVARRTLDDIERHLAQLEPGEQPAPDTPPCGHPRTECQEETNDRT